MKVGGEVVGKKQLWEWKGLREGHRDEHHHNALTNEKANSRKQRLKTTLIIRMLK